MDPKTTFSQNKISVTVIDEAHPAAHISFSHYYLPVFKGRMVGIHSDTAAGAALDVVSTNKGILIPRVETSSVTSPVDGFVFQPSNQHSISTPAVPGRA